MLQVSVSSVSDVFRGMLQVFHIGVTKVNQDVAYVVMVVHVYCKLFGPVRLAETWLNWLKTLFWLNCCERKTLFRLKKEAEQAIFKTSERGLNVRAGPLPMSTAATTWSDERG